MYFMAISPDFDKRLFTARPVVGGKSHSVHGRRIDGKLRLALAV